MSSPKASNHSPRRKHDFSWSGRSLWPETTMNPKTLKQQKVNYESFTLNPRIALQTMLVLPSSCIFYKKRKHNSHGGCRHPLCIVGRCQHGGPVWGPEVYGVAGEMKIHRAAQGMLNIVLLSSKTHMTSWLCRYARPQLSSGRGAGTNIAVQT